MANQITGKIKSIGQTQSLSSKNGNTFYKREIVLDTTRFDPYTGERSEIENYPMFEFSGERCKDLDGFKVGQVATISFDLQGSFYKGDDGKEKNFTRVRGYKIEARRQQVQEPQIQEPQQQQPPMPSDFPPPPTDGLPW